MKNQYREGDCLKRGTSTVCQFEGGARKRVVLFLRGGWNPNAHYDGHSIKLSYDKLKTKLKITLLLTKIEMATFPKALFDIFYPQN